MARPRTFDLDAHIRPQDIDLMVEKHPKLDSMVSALEQRHGLSKDQSKGFIRKMLRVLLDDFGETYLGEMSTRLERIANLRDRIVTVYDSVLAGKGLPEGMTPAQLSGLFSRLDSEMNGLKSPTLFAKEEALIRDDLASESLSALTGDLAGRLKQPQVVGRLSFDEAIAGQTKAFGDLPGDQKAAVARAADLAPDMVRRAIESENQPSLHTSIDQLRDELQRRDVDKAVIDAASEAMNALNFARNEGKRRARTGDRGPYDKDAPEGQVRLEAIDRFYQNLADPEFTKLLPDDLRNVVNHPVKGKVFQDPDLRKALESNSALARLAHESPAMLMDMWVNYSKSKKGSFGSHVHNLMRKHVIGLVGEFRAAFQLGDTHTLLKSPDYKVTDDGTDLVAVTHSDGTVWLLDNKAWQQSSVDKVHALVENILPSMEKDLREFASGLTNVPLADPPLAGSVGGQTIRDAADRLSNATKDLRDYLKDVPKSEIKTPEVQEQIKRILDHYRIKRVVTNAAGEVVGLSEALREFGIELHDLNK